MFLCNSAVLCKIWWGIRFSWNTRARQTFSIINSEFSRISSEFSRINSEFSRINSEFSRINSLSDQVTLIPIHSLFQHVRRKILSRAFALSDQVYASWRSVSRWSLSEFCIFKLLTHTHTHTHTRSPFSADDGHRESHPTHFWWQQ